MTRQEYKEVARRKRLTKARYRFATFEGQNIFIPSTEEAIRQLQVEANQRK